MVLLPLRLHGKLAKDTSGAPAIPHVPGKVNNDLYAVPVKRRSGEKSSFFADSSLPPGWERHEGEWRDLMRLILIDIAVNKNCIF